MPTNRDLRSQVAAASRRLREVDSPTLAEAIDHLLAPRGWVALRDTDPDGASGPTLTVLLTKEVRDQIVAAAAEAGVTVTDEVNDGYRKVVSGEYTPRKPARARYGAAEEKVTISITPSLSLRQQAEEQTGVSARHIAADYLMHRFSVGPYAPSGTDPLPPGATRNPQVPRTIRDLIRARAKDAGRKVTDDVNDGFQAFLDGTFVPVAPVWSDTEDLVNLRMTPTDDLYEQVRDAGELRPLTVAVAYLLDKYDIDPAKVQ
ncbi:hypothetical protein [Streptomyces sp. NPDC059783]|uniref:hypothetical protein n=1 Tax=Streptomyces sp. NPDC059783 TaxID=3346944 RepID=UPI003667ADBD